MLPNAAKCQAYSFYYFWVIKGKLTGGGKNTPSAFHFVEIQSAFYHMTALIQVSVEAFWHSYTWNLKYLCMRKLHLFINKYYLQVSWHYMDLKHILGVLLINEVCQRFYQLDRVNISKNEFWWVNFALPFCQICYIQKSTLWLV